MEKIEQIEQIDAILHYWFGHVEETSLPSTHRTWIWFSADLVVDAEIKELFHEDFAKAVSGELADWNNTPRGSLGLIILLDQFSRHIYRNTSHAYAQDRQALQACLHGIEQQHDHKLSLLERAFYYFPLMHSENGEMQALSVRAFEMLLGLSFQETRSIFAKFLDYALRHQEIISRFGRFPNRNEALGRISTEAELEFLKDTSHRFDNSN